MFRFNSGPESVSCHCFVYIRWLRHYGPTITRCAKPPSRHKNQCQFNVGLPPANLALRKTSIDSTSCVGCSPVIEGQNLEKFQQNYFKRFFWPFWIIYYVYLSSAYVIYCTVIYPGPHLLGMVCYTTNGNVIHLQSCNYDSSPSTTVDSRQCGQVRARIFWP